MERLDALLRGEAPSHILPFLWMKGEDNETIREELVKIEECGIREICLESRPHPDFCGPGWWENLDFILPEARKRGMRVWILDDDKFPTGHANGGFIRNPEKKKVYLAERHMDICGPCRSGAVLVENFLQPDGKLLGILAVPKPDGQTLAVSGDGILDLTDRYENGFVYFDLPPGPYRLFVLYTTQTGGGREDYMNLLDSDSVRVLIDEVHEKHYARYPEYFGNTIAGFFSDEPELGNVNGYPFDNTLGQKDRKLPWSGQLEAALREKWGDAFLFNLPALWYESGEKTPGIRVTYMDEMTGLVRTCFSGQLGSWCEAHGVEYIGHIIEDDNAHTRMACSIGHYFREMEGQHMAGIDVVHHQIVPGFTEPVHQWIAGDRDGEFFHFGLAKLGSSVAHIQANKKGRALCEIFGNYGWAEGNSLMKWLTNHMLVRGINTFTPHAFSMQENDRDCPPHFYARGRNPGFACFAALMKYMNRSAHLLSEGIHMADAAILYHAESEWSAGNAMFFHKPGRMLMERQLDYDVVPADMLRENTASIEEGQLVLGKEKYPCLILPFSRYLDGETARFLVSAARKGLKVFVIDALPEADTLGRPLPPGWDQSAQTVSLSEIGEAVEKWEEKLGNRELTVKDGERTLRSFLLRRPDGLTAMYFNESVSRPVKARVSIRDKAYGSVTVYAPWSNRAESYYLKGQEFPLSLDPGEAVFVVLDKNIQSTQPFPVCTGTQPLCVDWKLSMAQWPETEFTGERLLRAGEELPNLSGPGYWPSFTGVYRYECLFQGEKEDRKCYKLLIPEASDCVRVKLNDTDLGFLAGFPARADITAALKDGENRLELQVFTTLVWSRKDGASTHLQIPATGITEIPVVECYETGQEADKEERNK